MQESKDSSKWTIRDKVEYLLEKSERARNDDKYLTLLYWKFADKVDLNNLAAEYLNTCTPATSIIRARCLIQSEGLYPPRPEVAEHRGRKERAFRNNIAKRGHIPSDREVSEYDDSDEFYR